MRSAALGSLPSVCVCVGFKGFGFRGLLGFGVQGLGFWVLGFSLEV